MDIDLGAGKVPCKGKSFSNKGASLRRYIAYWSPHFITYMQWIMLANINQATKPFYLDALYFHLILYFNSTTHFKLKI